MARLYSGRYAGPLVGSGLCWFDIDGDGQEETIELVQAHNPPAQDAISAEVDQPDELRTLRIRWSGGRSGAPERVYEEDIGSAYFLDLVEFYDLFSDGRADLLIVNGYGRGTGVRQMQLHIQTWREGRFATVFNCPYGGAMGPIGGWQSRHAFADVNGDGYEDLVLSLAGCPSRMGREGDPWALEWIERVVAENALRIFLWDVDKRTFVRRAE